MTYFVNLVQRGISANTHPVSGRSGKGYGTAVSSPAHGGVIFKMSLQDYMNSAHDLCGNPIAGQQWVPEFVPEAGAQAQARPKCDRCQEPSVAIWDRFPFCAKHAPNNATWYDESERPATAAPAAPAPAPTTTPDVLPRAESPITTGVTSKETELAQETLPPPFMGSEAETTGGTAQPPPAVASEKVEPVAAPQSEAAKPPSAATVVQLVTESVIKALMPRIEERLNQMEGRAKAPAPQKNGKKRPAKNSAPTEFQLLQQRAKDLGVPTFGKGRAALEAAIKEKEAPPQPE